MRYDQLLTIIDEIKPSSIVEVGVARALRATAMVRRALMHRPDVHYTGYDVFETKDAEFQAAAYNFKSVATVAECTKALEKIRQDYSGFDFDLIVGDTSETLLGADIKADLVFIDGDHRVEAIRNDYRSLCNSSVVVFDDYYTSDDLGCPDTNKVGCNQIIDAMGDRAIILPDSDQVRDGGRVQMAVVRRCSGVV